MYFISISAFMFYLNLKQFNYLIPFKHTHVQPNCMFNNNYVCLSYLYVRIMLVVAIIMFYLSSSLELLWAYMHRQLNSFIIITIIRESVKLTCFLIQQSIRSDGILCLIELYIDSNPGWVLKKDYCLAETRFRLFGAVV